MSMTAPMADLPLFGQEPELDARDRVLDVLEEKRRNYVTRLRRELTVLYLRRRTLAIQAGENPDAVYVTSTDARALFESWPGIPSPDDLSRNFLGSTFRGADWEACGSEESKTPGRKGALIRRWKYVGGQTIGRAPDRGSPKGPGAHVQRGDPVRPDRSPQNGAH